MTGANTSSAPAPTKFYPNPDQESIRHLKLTVRSFARVSRSAVQLFVSCGGVAFPIQVDGEEVRDFEIGERLIAEYPKGNNPLNTPFSAIYPAHMQPAPQKEKPMTDIIVAGDGLSMTSLEIAALVESRHDSVKRTIERLANQGVIELPPTVEIKTATKPVTAYRFTGEQGKRDSIVVVAQLSPEFTAKLVDRWQELEKQIANQQTAAPALPDFSNPAAAARAWAEQFEQREQLAIENKAQAEALAVAEPKAQALDRISADTKSLTITQAAKVLEVKREELTNWMVENGWIYRQNASWVAYQKHIQAGRLRYKEANYTDEKTELPVSRPYCHITPKGLAIIAQALESESADAPPPHTKQPGQAIQAHA